MSLYCYTVMFENQYVVLVNVRKPFFCYVFAFFPEYVPPRQFLWGAKGWFPRMEGHTRVQKMQLYCGTNTGGVCLIPIQANDGRRWHLALPCLVDATVDEGPRPSVRPQLSLAMDRFNFLFFWWFSLGSCLMTSSFLNFHCWSLISSGWDVGRQCNC